MPAVSFAQDRYLYGALPVEDGKVYYENIIDVPNVMQDDLYKRAKAWLTSFARDKAAIQMNSLDSGIVVNGFFNSTTKTQYRTASNTTMREFRYTVIVNIKDEKARVIVSFITVKSKTTAPSAGSLESINAIEQLARNFDAPSPSKDPDIQKLTQQNHDNFVNDCKLLDKNITDTINGIAGYLTGKKAAKS